MKICNQPVHCFEFIRRIYEYARIAATRMHNSVVGRTRFEHAHGCSTHGYNASARGFCGVYLRRRAVGNAVIFAVHFMVFHVVGLDRQKRAQPHVQQHFGKLYTFLFKLRYQPFGKVQTRRRRGGRPDLICVHRLITVDTLQLLMDIMRQRNFAYAV